MKPIADPDSSSIAPSEGVPAFRVTFETSELDDDAHETSSAFGDGMLVRVSYSDIIKY